MTMSALIVVQLAEVVVGLTANERFKAVQNLDSGGGLMTSRWFTITMIILLAGSVIALVAVSLYRKAGELKTAEKSFSQGSAKKGLSESETDFLMAIAVKAGLKKGEDIFSMSEAFEQGAAKLLEESRPEGKSTVETSQLEKQLTGLRDKLGFRKAASVAASSPVKPVEKSASATITSGKPGDKPSVSKPADVSAHISAFIAMFPVSKQVSPAGSEKQEQPQQGGVSSPPGSMAWDELIRQLPEFVPAIVNGVVGQVVSVETALPANVGDRVLVVIELESISEKARERELIEDIGVVQRSVQPAESIDAPNARRLGIEIAGLSEAQAAQIAGVVSRAKATKTKTGNIAGSQDADDVSQSIKAKEGIE